MSIVWSIYCILCGSGPYSLKAWAFKSDFHYIRTGYLVQNIYKMPLFYLENIYGPALVLLGEDVLHDVFHLGDVETLANNIQRLTYIWLALKTWVLRHSRIFWVKNTRGKKEEKKMESLTISNSKCISNLCPVIPQYLWKSMQSIIPWVSASPFVWHASPRGSQTLHEPKQ